MNFETVSLLLSWVELGVLLAILFRLGRTFDLIANTQRELSVQILSYRLYHEQPNLLTSSCTEAM